MREALHILSNLVDPLGTPEFFPALYAECQLALGNDQCNIFYFSSQKAPACLFSTAVDPQLRRITRDCASQYISYGHRQDPTILAAHAAMSRDSGSFMRHLHARDVNNPAYHRLYYRIARVSEKISIAIKAAGGTYYLNFYRSAGQAGFSDRQISICSDVGDALCRLIAKHHLIVSAGEISLQLGDAPTRVEEMRRSIYKTLFDGPFGLTSREAEVCAAIAVGITTGGIGLRYGVTANTVATHRKRAYAKLGISSQTELFARCYDRIGKHAAILFK